MLRRLIICNYLLIEKANVDFRSNFQALIGESGAGKSLIVNILSLPHAKSIGSDLIGRWGDEASIKMEYDDPAGLHVLAIKISKTKTVFTLDDEPIAQKILKTHWRSILDVHSQNDFDLLRGDQLLVLDRFMTVDEVAIRELYVQAYELLRTTEETLAELKKRILSPVEREYFAFQLKELNDASLKVGEDDEYLSRLRLGRDREKLRDRVDALKGKMDELSETIAAAEHAWSGLQKIDTELAGADYFERLIQAQSDASWELVKRYDSAEIADARELASIETRLDQLEDLKRKYKQLIPDLIEFREKLADQLGRQDEFEWECRNLETERQTRDRDVREAARQLSEIRKCVAARLIVQLQQYMVGLKLPKAEFVSSFQTKERPDATGLDRFEFLVRVNVGSSFHSVTRLSGGESSRIMLAIKAALMEASEIGTYCFDEIDVGVSGDVATRMAELMVAISKRRQVIVVTHLPMVAALAETIFVVEKVFSETDTTSAIRLIDSPAEREFVLGRLLSDEPNEATTGFVRSLNITSK